MLRIDRWEPDELVAILLASMVCLMSPLNAAESPPVIRTPPQPTLVQEGGACTFTVTASGTAPLSYQWLRGDKEIAGATNRTLAIRPAAFEDAASYSVRVSNRVNAVESRPVELVVAPPLSALEERTFIHPTQSALPYRLFVPPNYDPIVRYPLVLFLHGGFELGTDNRKQVTAFPDPLIFVSPRNQREHPCFFVAPQCPLNSAWGTSSVQKQLVGLLDALAAEFSIDTNRLYVTGFSFGGYGTWDLVARYPELFAAAIPMCGGISQLAGLPSALRNLAVWNFHAIDDTEVPVIESRSVIDVLRRIESRPLYTEYRTGGHFMFRQSYLNPHLVPWTFMQRRGLPSTNNPSVTITSHPTDQPLRSSESVMTLKGHVLGLDGLPVVELVWTNTFNRSGGSITGSRQWTIEGIPLRHPGTNRIIVTGSISSGVAEYGGNTTFNDVLRVQTPASPKLVLHQVEGGIVLRWEPVIDGFRLQQTRHLNSGSWEDVAGVTGSQVRLPDSGVAAFFRMISTR